MGTYDPGINPMLPPLEPGDLPVEPAKWPKVLGIISIVLGGLGILKNIFTSYSNFTGSSMGGFGQPPEMKQAMEKAMAGMGSLTVALGSMSIVAMFVSVLLLVAGVQLLQRKRVGVKLHVTWAMVRLVTAILEIALVMYSQAVFLNALIEVMPHQPNGPPPATMAAIMRGFMFGCDTCFGLFALTYPIVVLVVLSRPWAKAEVARWGAGGGALHGAGL